MRSLISSFGLKICCWCSSFINSRASIWLSFSSMACWWSHLIFVCKLLPDIWEHHVTTLLYEVFCFWLLNWKYQLVHPFFIDAIVIFSRVPGPIYEVCFRNELCQLPLISVIFFCDKGALQYQRPWSPCHIKVPYTLSWHLSGFFIDGHNVQFHCIKGKWHDRIHLYYNFGPRRDHFRYVGRCRFFVTYGMVTKMMRDYFHSLTHAEGVWVSSETCISSSRTKALSGPSCK